MRVSGLHVLALLAVVSLLVKPDTTQAQLTKSNPWAVEIGKASIGWERHLECEERWSELCSRAEGVFRRAGKSAATAFLQRAINEVDRRSCGGRSATLHAWDVDSYWVPSETGGGTVKLDGSIFDAMKAAEVGLIQRRFAQASLLVGDKDRAMELMVEARRSYTRAYKPGSRARMEALTFLDQVLAQMEQIDPARSR